MTHLKSLLSATAASLVLGAAPTAQAWWGLGHSALCEAALNQVAPATRSQIESLIATDNSGQYQTFGSQCVWADDIKPERRETSPWHYINAPPGTTDLSDLERPEQGDILTALERFMPVLSDATASEADRLEALRFVGHFVGDLHQPMHVAYEEDWGGNKYRLDLNPGIKTLLHEDRRDRTNMHAVWDGYLLIYAADRADMGLLPLIESEAVDVDGDHITWANESLVILQTEPVRYATDERANALSEEYLAANADTAVARLRVGAARLAKLLDASFQTH